jgi:hypothetical protein
MRSKNNFYLNQKYTLRWEVLQLANISTSIDARVWAERPENLVSIACGGGAEIFLVTIVSRAAVESSQPPIQ